MEPKNPYRLAHSRLADLVLELQAAVWMSEAGKWSGGPQRDDAALGRRLRQVLERRGLGPVRQAGACLPSEDPPAKQAG